MKNTLEKIFVTYSNVTSGDRHMAINYINKYGYHEVIEAVPKNKFGSIRKLFSGIAEQLFSPDSNKRDSDFGAIETKIYEFKDSDTKLPSETLTEGRDLSPFWEKVKGYKRHVDLFGYEYRPFQNSNSFAARAIEAAGLPYPSFVDDAGMRHNLPGHETALDDPLDPTGRGFYDPHLTGDFLPGSAPIPDSTGFSPSTWPGAQSNLPPDAIARRTARLPRRETVASMLIAESTLKKRRSDIERMMGTDDRAYWGEPVVQEEYRQVVTALDEHESRKRKPRAGMRFYG